MSVSGLREGIQVASQSSRARENARMWVKTAGLSVVNRKKVFVCEFAGCGKSFLTMSGLRKHRSQHNPQNQSYVCDLCADKKTFKTKEVIVCWWELMVGLYASLQKQTHAAAIDSVYGAGLRSIVCEARRFEVALNSMS